MKTAMKCQKKIEKIFDLISPNSKHCNIIHSAVVEEIFFRNHFINSANRKEEKVETVYSVAEIVMKGSQITLMNIGFRNL